MDRWRFSSALALTAMATYGLLVTGSTIAAGVPMGVHVIAAGSLWLLVGFVAWRAWTDGRPIQTRLAITAALCVYPLQAGLGMLGLLGVGTTRWHLFGALVIFGLLVLALVFTLEAETENPAELATSRLTRSTGHPTDPAGDYTHRSAHPSMVTAIHRRFHAYLALTKPRLMWLLCLLALAGVSLAILHGAAPSGGVVVAMLGAGVLAIGASGTFNHVIEVDRDRRMQRTADRPLVTGEIDIRSAMAFGVVLTVVSLLVMLLFVNALATLLTAIAIVYYSIIYTIILKPNTTWNIAIGGGAGALPAVIGWAAATGSIGWPALLLAGVVVLWTPAHFYNLAIANRTDYAAAAFPMLPVVRGNGPARRRIVLLIGATLMVAALLAPVSGLGGIYALATVGVGGIFLWTVLRQARDRSRAAAFRSFHASNAYLGSILLAIVIEAVIL